MAAQNREGHPQHCEDHSGLVAWLKGIAAIMTIVATGIGGVLIQGYNIRADFQREVARIDKDAQHCSDRLDHVEKDMADIGRRVSSLEGK